MGRQCARCGKEIGFFEKKLYSEYPRLGIDYDCVCGTCHRLISAAVEKVDKIDAFIKDNIKKTFGLPLQDATLDELLFLGVMGLFKIDPDWQKPEDNLNELFIIKDGVTEQSRTCLDIILFRVLRSGFMARLGYFGVDTYEAFLMKMEKDTRCYLDIGANYAKGGRKKSATVFACRAGIVVQGSDGHVLSLPLLKDEQFKPAVRIEGASYVLTVTGLKWPDKLREPSFYFTRKETADAFKEYLDGLDGEKDDLVKRKEQKLLDNINHNVEKDLIDGIGGDTPIEKKNIDHILLAVSRVLLEEDYKPVFDGREPDKLMHRVLQKYYQKNLIRSGLEEEKELDAYFKENFLLVPELIGSEDNKEETEGWGLFAPAGFVLGFSGKRDPIYLTEERAPNNLYAEVKEISIGGPSRIFFDRGGLTIANGAFKGIGVRAKDMKTLAPLKQYIRKEEFEYLKKEYKKLLTKMHKDYSIERAAEASAEQLTKDFGLLPFTLIYEYEKIYERIRKEDPLMKKLLPPIKNEDGRSAIYTQRIVHEFSRAADQLKKEIGVQEISPVKKVLWDALSEMMMREAAQEFDRLTKDHPYRPGRSLKEAMEYYLALEEVNTDTAYMLGLFTYKLLSLGLLGDLSYSRAYSYVYDMYRVFVPAKAYEEEISKDDPDQKVQEETEGAQPEEKVKKEEESTSSDDEKTSESSPEPQTGQAEESEEKPDEDTPC